MFLYTSYKHLKKLKNSVPGILVCEEMEITNIFNCHVQKNKNKVDFDFLY